MKYLLLFVALIFTAMPTILTSQLLIHETHLDEEITGGLDDDRTDYKLKIEFEKSYFQSGTKDTTYRFYFVLYTSKKEVYNTNLSQSQFKKENLPEIFAIRYINHIDTIEFSKPMIEELRKALLEVKVFDERNTYKTATKTSIDVYNILKFGSVTPSAKKENTYFYLGYKNLNLTMNEKEWTKLYTYLKDALAMWR